MNYKKNSMWIMLLLLLSSCVNSNTFSCQNATSRAPSSGEAIDNDPIPPTVSISQMEVSEPVAIPVEYREEYNASRPQGGLGFRVESVEIDAVAEVDTQDKTGDETGTTFPMEIIPTLIEPVDVDGVPRLEIHPEGEFIPMPFDLPSGFSIVMTQHVGQQSIYHLASPGGAVFINMQYAQIRFTSDQTLQEYFSQYTEIEWNGQSIYSADSFEHGAFVTFEKDSILYTIQGSDSMQNLLDLCSTIL